MSVINLAHPQWLAVKCDQKLLGDVFCQVHKLETQVSVAEPKQTYCNGQSVLKARMCFTFSVRFVNFSNKMNSHNNRCKCALSDRDNIQLTTILQHVFMAVGGNWPPIFLHQSQNLLFVHRYARILSHRKQAVLKFSSAHVLNVFIDKTSLYTAGDNLKKCGNSSYLSVSLLCDGTIDCRDAADEEESLCGSKRLRHNTRISKCPPLLFQTHEHQCNIYFLMMSVENVSPKVTRKRANETCPDIGKLQCSDVSNECFDISHICQYQIDKHLQTTPCSAGQHLESCKHFECNLMFKCPHFYCIPWAYLCDGKWDCPSGIDEKQKCGSNRECYNLFRCRGANVCLHLLNVCDNVTDCPLKDDEQACTLSGKPCPAMCTCLVLAVRCKKIRFSNSVLDNIFLRM